MSVVPRTYGRALPYEDLLFSLERYVSRAQLQAAVFVLLPTSLHGTWDNRENFWNGCEPAYTMNALFHTATTRGSYWCVRCFQG